jgi:hypothetical protein
MQYLAMIVASLQEAQEGLNIAQRAVGLGNSKGLTDGTMAVQRGEEVILNSDHRYHWNQYKRVIIKNNESGNKQ